MLDLFFLAFALAFFGAGMRKPFLFVLAYTWLDIVAPQRIVDWGLISHIPISLIAFVGAFGLWFVADDKRDLRFSMRQAILLALLAYCFVTTQTADFPVAAQEKWSWVWKALVFAIFLPLTLRTRLRIEAMALIMVLSAGVIIIGGGIKTLASGGGGYGGLSLLVNDNTGLYEGSTLSMVAVAILPLIVWLVRHGTVFPADWKVRLFAVALGFACLLIPVGTQTRTGLLCIILLLVLSLRTVRHRFAYVALIAAAGAIAIPMLPASYKERMSSIENHQADQSASTRIAVWKWTIKYAEQHPFGGGFEAYRQNRLSFDTVEKDRDGSNVEIEKDKIVDKGRAYHSAYFEMLGEQGYPGLALWLLLQALGITQMEVLRRRFRRDPPQGMEWLAPLANALQQAQFVYLLGSLFVGIAFQPFCYMLIGLQISLWAYAKRIAIARPPRIVARSRRARPPTSAPALQS
ncbi:DUF5935 domain-containing protein [Novosphingobium sp. ZN18A2]|uniref:DUF5935 domain-containing protein n=1 Tax=Novosphingobium sp. ZN18A2 TaxID=3079861 RepID=UPI0030D31FD5